MTINAVIDWKIISIAFDSDGNGVVTIDKIVTPESGQPFSAGLIQQVIPAVEAASLLDTPITSGATIRQSIKDAVFSSITV